MKTLGNGNTGGVLFSLCCYRCAFVLFMTQTYKLGLVNLNDAQGTAACSWKDLVNSCFCFWRWSSFIMTIMPRGRLYAACPLSWLDFSSSYCSTKKTYFLPQNWKKKKKSWTHGHQCVSKNPSQRNKREGWARTMFGYGKVPTGFQKVSRRQRSEPSLGLEAQGQDSCCAEAAGSHRLLRKIKILMGIYFRADITPLIRSARLS